MQPQILGISGSPIKNSNTDRLVQAVLESSGLKSEFVKSHKNIGGHYEITRKTQCNEKGVCSEETA